MRPVILIAVILSFAMAARVNAESGNYYSGNQLWDTCRGSDDDQKTLLCIGYIAGVTDALINVQGAQRMHWFCVDPNAPLGQLREALKLWLGEHPQKRNLSGASAVLSVLEEKFPCKAKGSNDDSAFPP